MGHWDAGDSAGPPLQALSAVLCTSRDPRVNPWASAVRVQWVYNVPTLGPVPVVSNIHLDNNDSQLSGIPCDLSDMPPSIEGTRGLEVGVHSIMQ